MIKTNQIYQGDTLEILKTWPDEFVQCVVTSPPYWGLRDYGAEGQIGLESTPDEYVQKIVEVFRHVRRILLKDGTLWLNLGDSYSGSGKGRNSDGRHSQGTHWKQSTNHGSVTGIINTMKKTHGINNKNLIGIPWHVALALQADGWYLRSDIIWAKPNCMPESVTDRPTKSHEYIFLLTKSPKYFYDSKAIMEPAHHDGCLQTKITGGQNSWDGHKGRIGNERWIKNENMDSVRNKRSVWSIPTASFDGDHFATFPEEIPMICLKAGSRPGDIIMDPFMGSGTVGMVAKRLKRQYLGIELNPKYIAMAEKRIGEEQDALLVE